MTTYILQKDLPNLKAGAEFEYVTSETLGRLVPPHYYHKPEKDSISYDGISYLPTEVENNPEWFKQKPNEPPLMTFTAFSPHSARGLALENSSNISHAIRQIDGHEFTKANIVLNLSSQTQCNQAIEFLSVLGMCFKRR